MLFACVLPPARVVLPRSMTEASRGKTDSPKITHAALAVAAAGRHLGCFPVPPGGTVHPPPPAATPGTSRYFGPVQGQQLPCCRAGGSNPVPGASRIAQDRVSAPGQGST